MDSPRTDAIEIWTAGVDSVRACPLVEHAVRATGDSLQIGDRTWSRTDYDRILVVGAGKAGTAMAKGLLGAIGDWLPTSGWINVPEGTEISLDHVTLHPSRPAGVNEPTEAGVAGTREILRIVSDAGPRDLCIALISGGGSALMPAPCDGITLDDKLNVTRFLSGAGANILELNTVRKRLSKIKGGGLLRACRASEMITLVLSDVLGDPLDLIASGPTVENTQASDEALKVLRKYDADHRLPKRVYTVLDRDQDASSNIESDSSGAAPLCKHCVEVIGNNAFAVDHAGIQAEKLGYNHVMHSARECEGAAEDVGRHLAKMTVQMLRAQSTSHRNDCLITGGEPTVELAPSATRGIGGRNQQLVLAAYQHLLDAGLSEQDWNRICILSGGTDGEDGPTDAAGALLDRDVHQRACERGLQPSDFLQRNDAYSFFLQTGGRLMTGPTGTNVCDIRVALTDLRP